MPVAHSQLTLSYKDFSNENSTVKAQGVVFTAANHDATVALQDALATAVDGISKGNRFQTVRQANIIYGSQVAPVDDTAQRENKWLVSYEDDVLFNRHSIEIPCADTQFLTAGTDLADLTATEMAAFVTAFEAYAKSPQGNAVTVLSIKHVGRNI